MTALKVSEWLSGADGRVLFVSREREVTLSMLSLATRRLRLRLQAYTAAPAAGLRVAIVTQSACALTEAFLAVLSLHLLPVFPGHTRKALLKEQGSGFDLLITDLPELNAPEDLGKPCLLLERLPTEVPAEAVATEFMAEITESSPFVLYTSGSTGKPKAVLKTVGEMEAEARLIGATVPWLFEAPLFVPAVYPYHMFGLTFSVFAPLSSGKTLLQPIAHYSEELCALKEYGPLILIATPAFLKHLDLSLTPPCLKAIVCAGGPLENALRKSLRRWCQVTVTDIYGSTEAGVIAWRHGEGEDGEAPLTLFEDVNLEEQQRRESCVFTLNSGHVRGTLSLDDRLTLLENRKLKLEGRCDRILKIEEIRISLNEVEARLKALPYLSESSVVPVRRQGRLFTGAALVLDPKGAERLKSEAEASGKSVEQYLYPLLRRDLLPYLERVAIPRFIRIVDALPVTAMGKNDTAAVLRLFEEEE